MESSVWFEKYTPKTIEDVILPSSTKQFLIDAIQKQQLPNLGFWSCTPGLGKSCTAKAIIQSMNAEAMFLNASLEKGIEVLRTKIFQFASTCSLSGNPKIVVMDECLEENEEVILLENGKEKYVALKDLEKATKYDCLSFNLKNGQLEHDTCQIISDKYDTVYEVTLIDGRKIHVTSNHPFIVVGGNKFKELSIDDGLSLNDEVVCRWKDDLDFYDHIKIKSIIKLEEKHVINLCVDKNHTFLTRNGIITHNCDHITPDAQAAFRGFLDEFSTNCSFIFTGNYKTKIIEPLLNRLQNFDFAAFDKREIVPEILKKMKFILTSENVPLTENTDRNLAEIIRAQYPSIRGMIQMLQQFIQEKSFDGKIQSSNFESVMNTLRNKDYMQMLQEVNSLSNPESMIEYLYKRIDMFKNVPQAICVLSKYQYQSAFARDKYLNMSACLVELMTCL